MCNYDVVLVTDTGVLISLNTFVTSSDNGKHFLFSAIASIFCYPAYALSLWMSNLLDNLDKKIVQLSLLLEY
ncbi:hypothetical protein [Metaclostridioides mangenotii]|uniref:hypothetical protein n=1 Tax=Metaclostridioides mangenotii TaxID=1540 RepID=UPI000480D6E7|nr:hypothetical protein [Clostridioides mangenotii]